MLLACAVLLPVLPCLPQEGVSEPVGRRERWGGWHGVAEAQVPCPCALVTGELCCSLAHIISKAQPGAVWWPPRLEFPQGTRYKDRAKESGWQEESGL